MFAKRCFVLAAAVVPFAAGFTISTPTGLTSGGSAVLNWTTSSGDPSTFSIELINTAFNNAFGIANNVVPSALTISLTLPIVPVGDGYTIEFVNIGNISDVFASSGDFAIGATTSTTSASSTTSSGSSSSGASHSGSTSSVSTSAFGTTVSPSSSTGASSNTQSTGSTSSSSSSSSPSTFNSSGAKAVFSVTGTNVASYAVIVLGAVAGAIFTGI